jgi:hypothetical protein
MGAKIDDSRSAKKPGTKTSAKRKAPETEAFETKNAKMK